MSATQKKSLRMRPAFSKLIASVLLSVVAGFGLTSTAHADWNGGVTVGGGYSDNIRRVHSGEESDTILSAGVNFDVLRSAPHLYTDIVADLAYLDYVHDSFDKELIGNVNALLNAKFIPDRFEWLFQDNFGQVRSDPFAPLTPANRENVNYFSTGPQLTLPFGNDFRATVKAHYSLVDYERSIADNDGYGATVGVLRQFSQASSISLNGSGDRVIYKDASNAYADHDVRSVFANYSVDGARTKVSVDAGYNQLEYRSSEQKTSGTLIRLLVTRKLTPSSSLTFRLGREFTDGSNAFQSDRQNIGAQQGLSTANVTSVADPYVSRYANLNWDFSRSRSGFGLNAGYSKENYQVLTIQDRTRIQGDVYLSRQTSPATRLRLSANYLREEIDATSVSFNELGESLEFAWQIGRLTALSLQLQHYGRSAEIASTEYGENRAWLSFSYGQAPRAMTQR